MMLAVEMNMKDAAVKSIRSIQQLRQKAVSEYADKLRRCFQLGPSAAATIHAHMITSGFMPDRYTLKLGYILNQLIVFNYESNKFDDMPVKPGFTWIFHQLIDFYCKSSNFNYAKKLFDDMPVKPGFTWTTMINGYVRNRDEVLEDEDFVEDEVFEEREDFEQDWHSMISGYADEGMVFKVFEIFKNMHRLGIKYDDLIYHTVLCACADWRLFLHGKQIHAYILRTEAKLPTDFEKTSTALIILYWKCAKINQARNIFDTTSFKGHVVMLYAYLSLWEINEAKAIFSEIPEKGMKNKSRWLILISGLGKHGLCEEALKLFYSYGGIKLWDCTLPGVNFLVGLEAGRIGHCKLIKAGSDSNLPIGNHLIMMYSVSAAVDAAYNVFLTMPRLNFVSWNAMIAALALHRRGAKAIELYEQMLAQRIKPDGTTFLSLLIACKHAGLVEEGKQYFKTMYKRYGIAPSKEHYARLIDLLCQHGKLADAENVIRTMSLESGARIWNALRAACWLHEDLGVHGADKLFDMITQDGGTYVRLANMFADAWEDATSQPGCSWIDVNNKVHVFLGDDGVHPEVDRVYSYLKDFESRMRRAGYLHESSEQKEESLPTHSEKLAVVYGILKLPHGATIRIFKNLGICRECHSVIKLMTKARSREIIVRDETRFHHFKNGKCSCGDHW